MKRVKVQVTNDDIKRGARTTSRCPVARAVARRFAVRLKDVSVGSAGVVVWAAFPANVPPLPSRAAAFIANFDAGDPVKPIAFFLNCEHTQG